MKGLICIVLFTSVQFLAAAGCGELPWEGCNGDCYGRGYCVPNGWLGCYCKTNIEGEDKLVHNEIKEETFQKQATGMCCGICLNGRVSGCDCSCSGITVQCCFGNFKEGKALPPQAIKKDNLKLLIDSD
jgi:hypothetical protein